MRSEHLRAWRARLLVGQGTPRQRLPRDVVGVVLGGAAALAGWLAIAAGAGSPVHAQAPLVVSWLVTLVALSGTWAMLGAALLLCALGRRWVLAARLVATAGVAALICVGVAQGLGVSGAYAPPLLAATFAVAVLAIRTLAAPLRIWWWGLVVMASTATLFIDHLVPLGALASTGLGVMAGAAVGLAFGTLGGGVAELDVAEILRQLGVEVVGMTPAARPPTWGVVRFVARDDTDRPVDIDIYGRDAPEGQFLARLWRFAWLRRSTLDLRLRRTDHVQHAMGLMLWAREREVGAPEVITVGRISPSDDIVLVTHRPPGTPLSEMAPSAIGDDVLQACWLALERLHDAQVALDTVRPDTIAVDQAGHISFCEFSRAEAMAGAETCRRDDAALLVALSQVVGPARAVHASNEAIGGQRLTDLLPLVQPQALPAGPGHRSSARLRKELGALRAEGAAQLGIDPVEPAPLARVQLAKVLMWRSRSSASGSWSSSCSGWARSAGSWPGPPGAGWWQHSSSPRPPRSPKRSPCRAR